MTHSYVWHDSFIRVRDFTHIYDMSHMCDDPYMCVARLVYVAGVRRSPRIGERLQRSRMLITTIVYYVHVWHDSFVRVAWLIYLSDMSHSCVGHDPFFFHRSALESTANARGCWWLPSSARSPSTASMSHWRRHIPHTNGSCRTCEWVMSHVWMSHVPRMPMTYIVRMSHVSLHRLRTLCMNESCLILTNIRSPHSCRECADDVKGTWLVQTMLVIGILGTWLIHMMSVLTMEWLRLVGALKF